MNTASSRPDPGPIPAPRRRRIAAATTLAVVVSIVLALNPSSAGAVVGGTPTDIESTPWQVSLQDGGGHMCGGSIIDPSVILTASHCVAGVPTADLAVRAGVSDHTDTQGQDRTVARVIDHPDGFDDSADVALLVLSEPLDLGPAVQTLDLASADDVAAAVEAVVSGWGATSEYDEAGTQILLSAQVPLLDDSTCAAALAAHEFGDDASLQAARELCAEGTGEGSCYGDSGGPLSIVGEDGRPKLAGVVSWGLECGYSPGVFTEVPAFADWIQDGVRAGLTGADHPGGETDHDAAVEASGDTWDDETDGDWTDETNDDWTEETDDRWTDGDWTDDDWTDEDCGEEIGVG